MTVLSEVPALYRTRWNSSTTFTFPGPGSFEPKPSNAPDSTPHKLNTSCVNCRNSRVKCTGGNPCNRCAASSHSLHCEYGVSRRRGKRKASDSDHNVLQPTEPKQIDARGLETTSSLDLEFTGSVPLDTYVDDGSHTWGGFGFPGPEIWSLNSVAEGPNEVSSPGFSAFLNNLKTPDIPPGPIREDKGTCPNQCFVFVHSVTNSLASSNNATMPPGFDRTMCILDESIANAKQYLACLTCDAGCPRLMTLSLLHQRQIDSLTGLIKDPGSIFSEESPRVAFGVFKPYAEDDINCKRVVLLRVARDIGQSLNNFHDGAKEFEERYNKGTLELGDAGKMNLNWLLGVAGILKKRLDCLILLVQKPDWAAQA